MLSGNANENDSHAPLLGYLILSSLIGFSIYSLYLSFYPSLVIHLLRAVSLFAGSICKEFNSMPGLKPSLCKWWYRSNTFSKPLDRSPFPADKRIILWGSDNLLRKFLVWGLEGLPAIWSPWINNLNKFYHLRVYPYGFLFFCCYSMHTELAELVSTDRRQQWKTLF